MVVTPPTTADRWTSVARPRASRAVTAVMTPEGGPGQRIVLYEIYDDAAAFDAHLATPHFASFNEATAALVAKKTVHRLSFAAP